MPEFVAEVDGRVRSVSVVASEARNQQVSFPHMCGEAGESRGTDEFDNAVVAAPGFEPALMFDAADCFRRREE